MKCRGCFYRRKMRGFGEVHYACHYSIDTGELRECSAKQCFEEKVHYAKGDPRERGPMTKKREPERMHAG